MDELIECLNQNTSATWSWSEDDQVAVSDHMRLHVSDGVCMTLGVNVPPAMTYEYEIEGDTWSREEVKDLFKNVHELFQRAANHAEWDGSEIVTVSTDVEVR